MNYELPTFSSVNLLIEIYELGYLELVVMVVAVNFYRWIIIVEGS